MSATATASCSPECLGVAASDASATTNGSVMRTSVPPCGQDVSENVWWAPYSSLSRARVLASPTPARRYGRGAPTTAASGGLGRLLGSLTGRR